MRDEGQRSLRLSHHLDASNRFVKRGTERLESMHPSVARCHASCKLANIHDQGNRVKVPLMQRAAFQAVPTV